MENQTANTSTAAWKDWLKKTGIFLLKLFFLLYTLKFLWKAIKNLGTFIWQGLCEGGNLARSNAQQYGQNNGKGGRYPCQHCGEYILPSAKVCPYCKGKITTGNYGSAWLALFLLPINLTMAFVCAAPTLLLLALATGNMASVDAAINSNLPQ